MGVLKDLWNGAGQTGQAIGQAGAGFVGTGAPALSSGALASGAIGVGLDTAAAGLSGLSMAQQFAFRSDIASTNAKIMRGNAQTVRNAGVTESSNVKLKTGTQVAAQRAAYAGSGIDVNSGSAADVQAATKSLGEYDANMTQYNAARAAYGLDIEAANQKAQSKMDRMASYDALAEGVGRAGSTFISGANSLVDKWYSYKRSGASNRPTVPTSRTSYNMEA